MAIFKTHHYYGFGKMEKMSEALNPDFSISKWVALGRDLTSSFTVKTQIVVNHKVTTNRHKFVLESMGVHKQSANLNPFFVFLSHLHPLSQAGTSSVSLA